MTFRAHLTGPSLLRYIAWRLMPGRRPVWLRLRSGAQIELRPRGKRTTNNDYGVAYEVFVHQYYDPPFPIAKADIRHIVDLGANVGYSALYLMYRYPLAHLLAFEPHPDFFAQLEKHMTRNGLRQRCDLRLAAAGTSQGVAMLSDAGSSSRLVGECEQMGQKVQVLDFFDTVGETPIDILKIDIEGAERVLLADSRFAHLKVRYLVLEWHNISGEADGRACSVERLRSLGYEVFETMSRQSHGMLWARTSAP